ncbi:MAG: P1 family peptidase [Actinobacteria bacterium]|nr:P1 family peptidase [Actinomycetota bacterium]
MKLIGSIKIGHAVNRDALKGCTVFLLPEGVVASCEVRGGAPGTRETDLLKPTYSVPGPNAILFSGGSAFGLNAAAGVVKYLEENGLGFPTTAGPVPIVSAAVIYDLDVGDGSFRPGPEMAYEACVAASEDERSVGNAGAGIGATVGNTAGRALSTKGGFGISVYRSGDFQMEAAAVVNSFGDVTGEDGRVIAGVRGPGNEFIGAESFLLESAGFENYNKMECTTLVIVATNAKLNTEQLTRVAIQGHNGIARAIRPSHTAFDGDTVFSVAAGEVEAPLHLIETLAAMCVADAVRDAVMKAESAGGVPAACDILGSRT